MESYDPSDFSAMSNYLDLLSKEVEMKQKFDEIDDQQLNDAEATYYAEVSLRCSQKILTALSNMN